MGDEENNGLMAAMCPECNTLCKVTEQDSGMLVGYCSKHGKF